LISDPLDDEKIRLREEITKQIIVLNEIKKMALSYGFDVSVPASNSKEAVQWVYLAYLSAIKEQD
jgi:formate C-acetyltransferase